MLKHHGIRPGRFDPAEVYECRSLLRGKPPEEGVVLHKIVNSTARCVHSELNGSQDWGAKCRPFRAGPLRLSVVHTSRCSLMSTAAPNTLDVRPLPADRTFETVLSVFEGLEGGDSFVLVDDRDPTALRTQIEEKRPGEVRWVYLKEGPHVWYVQVVRLRTPT